MFTSGGIVIITTTSDTDSNQVVLNISLAWPILNGCCHCNKSSTKPMLNIVIVLIKPIEMSSVAENRAELHRWLKAAVVGPKANEITSGGPQASGKLTVYFIWHALIPQ